MNYENVKLSQNKIEVNVPAVSALVVDRRNLRYGLEIHLETEMDSGVFEPFIELEASEVPPYRQLESTIFEGAYFPIHNFLDGLLKLKKPLFGQNVVMLCEEMIKPYKLKYSKKNDDVLLDGGWLEAGHVLKAGIDENDLAVWGQQVIKSEVGLAGKFLTWQPDNKLIDEHQQEYLYFLTNMVPAPAELRVVVNPTPALPTGEGVKFEAFRLVGCDGMRVYCLPASMLRQAQQPSLGIDLSYGYSVHVENEAGVRISEVRHYVIDTAYNEQSRYILFSNSLGGFDTLRATGQGSEKMKVVRQSAERYYPFSSSATYSEKIINKITGERSLVITTGYLTTQESEYLQELVLAKECYLQTDREYIPMTLVSDGYTTQEDGVYVRGRVFEFVYSNKTHNYSRLPIAPAAIARTKAWRVIGVASACEIDDHGIYTGRGKYDTLELYYTDDNTAFVPQTTKKNKPGTEGYIAFWASSVCEAADTPFVNVRKSKMSTFAKNNCLGFDQEGQKVEIVVEAGVWGSEISQADADAKAMAELASLDTQAYVNQHGVCRQLVWIGYGTQINCFVDEFGIRTGQGYYEQVQQIHQDDNSPVVPERIEQNRIGMPIPYGNGLIEWTYNYIVGPTEVASCAITPYRSVAINRAINFVNQNCVAPLVGAAIVVSVKAGKFGSEISQADADAKAEAYWSSFNTQIHADMVGSCIMRSYTPGLRTSFYNYAHTGPNPWGSLPSVTTRGFEVLKHQRIEANMNFADTNGAGTFPIAKQNGWNGQEAAIRFEGYIEIATAGSYDFKANFDDGIVLKVNGVAVIDHYYYDGGVSNSVYGTAVNLPAGKVPIMIEYYNAAGYGALALAWRVAGQGAYAIVPDGVLSHIA